MTFNTSFMSTWKVVAVHNRKFLQKKFNTCIIPTFGWPLPLKEKSCLKLLTLNNQRPLEATTILHDEVYASV